MNGKDENAPQDQRRIHETGASMNGEREGAPRASWTIVTNYYNYAARYLKKTHRRLARAHARKLPRSADCWNRTKVSGRQAFEESMTTKKNPNAALDEFAK